MARLPSPPTATSASRWWRPMVSSTARERSTAVFRPAAPTGQWNGSRRLVAPRTVPPWMRMPDTSSKPSGRDRSSTSPAKPSKKPVTRIWWPWTADFTMERRVAFIPGQSPPPVSTPICWARAIAGRLRLVAADGEDGNRRQTDHALGHAAHEEAPQGRAAVGANHDEVGSFAARPAEDVRGGGAAGQPGLGAHAFTPRAGEQRLEPTLGLPASAGLELQIAGREIDVTGEKRRGRQEDMKNEQPRPVAPRERDGLAEGRARGP